MTSTTFKELKDGRYRLRLPNDVRDILYNALMDAFLYDEGPDYLKALLWETAAALMAETIRLRKSECLLLFSEATMRRVNTDTQRFISAWLDLPEVQRRMSEPKRRINPALAQHF